MADKSYNKQSSERFKTITEGKLVVLVKATVSESDTVTIVELSDAGNIDFAKAVVHSTGLECAISITDNVITITETPLTDKEVYLLAAGDAA